MNERIRRSVGLALAMTCLWAAGGCPGDLQAPAALEPLPQPVVATISRTAVSVGDEIELAGSGFVDPAVGRVEVTFEGVYEHAGRTEPVTYTTEVEQVDGYTLRLPAFGPHRIPFTRAGNEVGVFRGEVVATNVAHDGREQRGPRELALGVELEVLPSLVIRELTATGDGWEAGCEGVATTLVNLVPYRLTVETAGFEVERVSYTVGEGLLVGGEPADEPVVIEHASEGSPMTIDALGAVEPLRFAEVPFGVTAYRASIDVRAVEPDGTVHDRFLMLVVRQPLFVRGVSPPEPAEIMEPVPISGCIPGGTNGRDVTYSESVSETRTISSQQTWRADWTETYSQSETDTVGGSTSETSRIGFSSSDQSHWTWNVYGEVMVGAEGGVPLIGTGKVELRAGAGREWGESHTETQSSERSWTSTSSYSEARTLTEQIASSLGQSLSETWTVSSSESEALDFRTFLLPNHFGVFYRQTTRLVSRGEIVALDLCGEESVVGEMILNDYTWAPDLAMGAECPPFPESQLPEAQCLLPPCEEI